jgi:hypothetical protein
MTSELIKLADHLDRKGMHEEANYLDSLVKKARSAGDKPDSGEIDITRSEYNTKMKMISDGIGTLSRWATQVEGRLTALEKR